MEYEKHRLVHVFFLLIDQKWKKARPAFRKMKKTLNIWIVAFTGMKTRINGMVQI
ncbi:hypothetical protein [Ileibacterium valens]|uniref:hypothetical protein n=1 Tax=Ileibacterium valens TaxID=1862668 RepID=UPI0027299DCF|nr:hypothetical protein [Ileibacterium valens]